MQNVEIVVCTSDNLNGFKSVSIDKYSVFYILIASNKSSPPPKLFPQSVYVCFFIIIRFIGLKIS